jgi:hypothetical protein
MLQSFLPEPTKSIDTKSTLDTFTINFFGYCIVLVPGYLLYLFAQEQDLGGRVLVLIKFNGTMM